MERTLVITGKGKLAVDPDVVIVKFPIGCLDVNYGVAVNELNNLVDKLRKAVSLCGMDEKELKTIDFRVDTVKQWNKKTEASEFVGFKAQHDLSIEFPLDNSVTNKLITSFIELDLNVEFKIRFSVKDKERCLEALIENAILNAKNKAHIIAKASAIKLKEIVNINYSFADIYFHSDTSLEYSNVESYERESATSFPDITPAEINLAENVTITWRIE